MTDFLKDFLKKFPDATVTETKGEYIIHNVFSLNHIHNGVRMTGDFCLEIILDSNFPNSIPRVKELSKKINQYYPHLFSNGQLCLASEFELKVFFAENTDICLFVDRYIIPYLYTYCYYETYGVYPYGERSHGMVGNIEYLSELFNLRDDNLTLRIIYYIATTDYRGHIQCPCNSGKRLRNCHGEVIKKVLNAGLKVDCQRIVQEIIERSKQNGTRN